MGFWRALARLSGRVCVSISVNVMFLTVGCSDFRHDESPEKGKQPQVN